MEGREGAACLMQLVLSSAVPPMWELWGGGGWFVSCVGPFSCLGKARSVCAGMCGVGGSCWNLMEELQPRELFNYVHFWTVTQSSAAPCRELLVLQ